MFFSYTELKKVALVRTLSRFTTYRSNYSVTPAVQLYEGCEHLGSAVNGWCVFVEGNIGVEGAEGETVSTT